MKCPVLYFIPPQSRLFNSRLRCGCGHRCALVAIASQPPWAVGHAQRAIQVLMPDDRTAGERPAPTHLVDLQGQVLKTDGVVAVDGALELQGEGQVEIAAWAGGEGCAALGGRHLKSGG